MIVHAASCYSKQLPGARIYNFVSSGLVYFVFLNINLNLECRNVHTYSGLISFGLLEFNVKLGLTLTV